MDCSSSIGLIHCQLVYLFTLLVFAQVNKLHHNPQWNEQWTLKNSHSLSLFAHWIWDTSLTLFLCNENLWKLNIFFLRLDRCHSSENLNADDCFSLILCIFSFSLKTRTQEPPKCLQWIADAELSSKKWHAIKIFRFVSFLSYRRLCSVHGNDSQLRPPYFGIFNFSFQIFPFLPFSSNEYMHMDPKLNVDDSTTSILEKAVSLLFFGTLKKIVETFHRIWITMHRWAWSHLLRWRWKLYPYIHSCPHYSGLDSAIGRWKHSKSFPIQWRYNNIRYQWTLNNGTIWD